jgi:hypothetical protein
LIAIDGFTGAEQPQIRAAEIRVARIFMVLARRVRQPEACQMLALAPMPCVCVRPIAFLTEQNRDSSDPRF